MTDQGKTWFITGCSSGFGRALAEQALERGDRVAVTARRLADIADIVARHAGRAGAFRLDVTQPDQVRLAVDEAWAGFDRIDVVVNNAGYGLEGPTEQATEAQIRAVFETNVFGVLNVIRATLPRLRAQGGGHIMNVTSVGGRLSAPMIALYSATKYAVEGLSAGLAAELAPQGVKVTAIEPGFYDTNFAKASIVRIDPGPVYAEMAAAFRNFIESRVPDDPRDAAIAMARIVDLPEAPRQITLGRPALAAVEGALGEQQAELARWRDLSELASGTA
jgi:NAD(P)-dependent dehydrogenase (short-subunit alcohol dehydrogenase family)